MYCNSCMTQINKDDLEFCSQCNVPLHKECANHCLTCGKTLCDVCYLENNYNCEVCNPPKQNFKVIRRSHIELANTCMYALYLTLEKGITPEANEYATLGTIVHQIIDMLCNKLIEADEAYERFDKEFDKELKEFNDESFKEIGYASIRKFIELKELFNNDKFTSEENIIYSIDDNLPSISCTLDRIDFINDEIHISDWKTGKPMSGQKLITDLQAPLYIEAIHQKYGVYPKTFTFYYLAKDKIKQYVLIPQDGNGEIYPLYKVNSGRKDYILDINDRLEETKKILTKINNRQFSMPKDVSLWYCQRMCWFYKSGICASSDKEQWKVLSNKYNE